MSTAIEEQVYLGRQPILDRSQAVFAYELLFRSGRSATASVTDDFLASATVIINTISQMGIDDVLEGDFGFLNVSCDLLMSDMLELLPSDRIVLEILESVEVDDKVVTRCRELKSKGFALAIDDYRYQPGYDDLFEIVDYLKFDLLTTPSKQVIAAVDQLGRWDKIKFLAEKVEHRDQFELYHGMGFSLFQGYFFAKPAVISGRKIHPNQVTLLRVLGQILNDAEVTEINDTFQECPSLGLGLLRLVNSVAVGLRNKIGSLHQALVVLGKRQLLRWAQLLLYSQGGSDVPSPLMTMAAVRGKAMELLCDVRSDNRRHGRDLCDRAFMTGVLSLVDVVVGMEKAQVVQQLNLADDVREALLTCGGLLGQMLLLMEQLERGDFKAAAILSRELNLLPEAVNQAQVDAMRWARHLGEVAP